MRAELDTETDALLASHCKQMGDIVDKKGMSVRMIEIERGVKASSEDSMGWEIVTLVDAVDV